MKTALTTEILSQLWTSYRHDPGNMHDISALCVKNGADPMEAANELRLKGLIKDDVAPEGGKVMCAISLKGIAHLDSDFVEEKIREVLDGMGNANSISNVTNILKSDAKQFQFAFDLANEMQNRDLVKLLYAFQPGNVVSAEMTLEGVRCRRSSTE